MVHTIWVYQEGINRKIKVSDWPIFRDEGWMRGRRMTPPAPMTSAERMQIAAMMSKL